jgi:hypothetical protein
MEVRMHSEWRPDGWHYRHNGEVRGPISPEQLKQLLQLGELTPQQAVWCQDQRRTTIFVHADRVAYGCEKLLG